MIPSCITPTEEINTKREITIKFPDATFTLVKLTQEGTTLVALYTFEDTTGRPMVSYQNCYSLDAFQNISGPIRKIEFRSKVKSPSS